MSRRDSEENLSSKGANTPTPRRDADADVDHLRLAQLVAANYTPPASLPPSTQLDARPAAALLSSLADAAPPEPPAQRSAPVMAEPDFATGSFEPPRMMAAAPLPHAYAAPQSYAPPSMMSAQGAPKSSLSCALLGALVMVLLIGGVLFAWRMMSGVAPMSRANVNTNASRPINPAPAPTNVGPSVLSQVFVAGGTFRMGRDDVGVMLLNESPSHEVAVAGFFIDRTEVTNAEYAEFVRATGHPAPSAGSQDAQETPYWKPWSGTSPPAGQELWPVRNVTEADARAFAAWRSRRDGVAYRLPTEEEWEYAARSGGAHKLYPWGDEFLDDHGVLDAALPQPVGSRPRGASREGVLDLIGNVWEWTSSDASAYPGSRDRTAIDKGLKVARGGSYQSKARGGAAVTATTRIFIPPDTRHPTMGFRLVREARNR